MKFFKLSLLVLFFIIPTKVFADVHNRPVTTLSLSPSSSSPGQGLSIYSDPVTVTLQATADTGYSIANTYYQVDNGSQQTYSTPFTVSGSGTHTVTYWSVDNSGLQEFPTNAQSFIITPQQGVINSIIQDPNDGTTLNLSVNFDNFPAYTSQLFNDDCYNDDNAIIEIYNADTGALVASRRNTNGVNCYSLGSPSQTLVFSNLPLQSGNYFIHYHGGDNEEWITNTFAYTAPVPHNKPVSTSSLSPSPTQVANGLFVYSNPVTMTIQATADSGYTIANTYYEIDGSAQQTYSAPFTVSGSGTHTVTYWSVDNSGLQESPEYQTFIVTPQQGVINSIFENSSQTEIDFSVNFDNFAQYTSQLFNDDCYNDPSSKVDLYDADNGNLVLSESNGGSNFHCYSLGSPYQTLAFFTQIDLPSGNYFIHYHGGDNEEWITNTFNYNALNPAHLRPTTTATLSPSPSTPGQGLTIYSNPVTVSLSATADNGYQVANTYYIVDNGSQQTYTSPFTVSGSGTHVIQYWSVDSSGLEEQPHNTKTFIITPQNGVIKAIIQGGITINAEVNFDNFSQYTSQLFNDDCYNDSQSTFEIYNASTGALVSSIPQGGGYCYSLGNPYQTLVFPPLQLPYGTYFIHYHGGDNEDWLTDTFTYTANVAPVVSAIPNNSITVGNTYSYSGSFNDTDSSSWTATVDYGDGGGVQPLTLSGMNFNLSHQYNTAGTYTLTVNVTDNQGAIGTTTSTITVNNPSPTPTPTVTPTPTPSTTTLTPTADSFIQHNEQNSNEGSSPFLELSVEGKERALIQFSESQIQAAVGNDPNYTATLQLKIVSNNNKWSTGRQIDVDRMEQAWTEGNGSYNYNNNRGTGSGVTWDCATDTNITNQSDNCSGSTIWDMIDSGSWPFNSTPTATTTITNNQTGTVSFNVTSDVQSFLNGTTNDGWIVRKDDETADGDIQFGSRETGNSPKLIITLH